MIDNTTIFDSELFMKRIGDNIPLAFQLIYILEMKEYPKFRMEFKQHHLETDSQELSRLTHDFKGSLSVFSDECQMIADKLNKSILNGENDKIEGYYQTLLNRTDSLIDELHLFIKDHTV